MSAKTRFVEGKSRMFRNKKAITYILVASFMLVVLLTVFSIMDRYTHQDAQSLQQIRIRTMNDFVKNLDEDIRRATYISAFRSLISLEDYVTSSGDFLNDTNTTFRQVFYYGNIDNRSISIMTNSSFRAYIARVNMLANNMGINLTMNVTKISLSQKDPWSIDVVVSTDINIRDIKGTASWMFAKDYSTNIPIYDLRDPLYGKYTLNRIPNTIRRLNVTYFVSPSNDTTNLKQLINGSYYVASSYAPSFLDRFEGKTSSNPNGIESIVNIEALSVQDISVDEDAVKVDYIYFNNLASDKICNVQNMPSDLYFVIPSNRASMYDVDDLIYSTSCP